MLQSNNLYTSNTHHDFWDALYKLRYILYVTPWNLVRKRNIPTKRLPLVGKLSANFTVEKFRVVSATETHGW
jgi:hypothetical protein